MRADSACPACAPEVELAGGTCADIAVDKAVTAGNPAAAPVWPVHPALVAQWVALPGLKVADG